MNIVIRADASSWIGSGHVVRCTTLARVLRKAGAEVKAFFDSIKKKVIYGEPNPFGDGHASEKIPNLICSVG